MIDKNSNKEMKPDEDKKKNISTVIDEKDLMR